MIQLPHIQILFESPLHLAAVSGHLENSKCLKKNINPGNDYGETPLHSAAANGHLVNSKAQKENINPRNNFGETPLHSAATRDQLNSKSQKKRPGKNYGEYSL